MEPTIAIDVEERHTVAQKEVFGPVPAVRVFEDEDDALRLANSTDYDLAGGRLDVGSGTRIACYAKCGLVWST